jgi:hypothetical protein
MESPSESVGVSESRFTAPGNTPIILRPFPPTVIFSSPQPLWVCSVPAGFQAMTQQSSPPPKPPRRKAKVNAISRGQSPAVCASGATQNPAATAGFVPRPSLLSPTDQSDQGSAGVGALLGPKLKVLGTGLAEKLECQSTESSSEIHDSRFEELRTV